MSTPAEVLLITVDIVANTARLVELTKQLNENKAVLKALEAANKAGTLSADELAAGQVRLKQQAAELAGEVRVLTKANADQEAVNKAAAGSINQLRAELARGTAAYNALSEAERDATDAGQALQSQNKALSDRLKELEGAVGDTRRNVGNYAGSLKDAIKESGFLGGITQKVTEAQDAFTNAQNIAKAAIGGNVTALGFLRLALLATGLGALVVVLGSVVAFLTKTQAGTDLVARQFAGLRGVLNLIIGTASDFGAALFKAADDPKKAFADLVDFIGTNLLNRIKSFAVILEGLRTGSTKKLTDGFIQLTVGIADSTDKTEAFIDAAGRQFTASAKLEGKMQELGNAERELNLLREESRAKIQALNQVAEDTTRSLPARAAAAKAAAAIENQLLERQLSLQDKRIALRKEDIKLRKSDSDADADALAALQGERAEIMRNSIKVQTDLQNKINAINGEAAVRAEARRKKLDEALLASIEAEIAAGATREAAAAKFLDEQLAADQRELASAEKVRTDKLAADAEAYARQESSLERFLARMQTKTLQDYAAGLISERDYNAAIELQEKTSLAARLLLATKFEKDTTALVQEQARAEIAARQKAKNQRQSIQNTEIEIGQAGAAAAQAATDTFIQAVGEESKAGQDALVIKKGIALAEIGISLQKQIIANALAGAKISAEAPPITVPLGIAYTATQNVLAIAQAAVGAASVLAFNTGGVVPGQGNSDTVPALLTPGEVVLKKEAVAQIGLPFLSHLNQLGGGVAFNTGGVVPGASPRAASLNDGGFLVRNLGGYSGPSAKEIAYELARVVPRQISVTAINSAQANKTKVNDWATLGG